MIALGIVLTWLALTVAGFAALSALGRIELGDGLEPDRASHARAELAPTAILPAMPGVSPR